MSEVTEHPPTLPPNRSAPTDGAIVSYLRAVAQEKLALDPAHVDLIALDLRIVEGLQLDSLAQVTLLAAIEDDFGMTIEFEDRERVHTVGDLVTLIRARATRSVPCN